MKRILAAVSAVSVAAIATVTTAPAQAQNGEATVSVLHGVPGLTVDVYANGEELIPDFEPGTLTDPLTIPAGTYDLAVYADGDTPDTADPAIKADGVEVPAGANATVVAHLQENGRPKLTPFVNDTSPTAAGEARLVVRHTAAAPAVDVRANGDVLFGGLTNPNEESGDVPAGTYSADVTLAGENDAVLGPVDVNLGEGTSTIVYAWGSAEEGNLDLAVQTIDGLHSSPSGVPGGETGEAAAVGGAPTWVLGLGLLSAVALVLAARRVVPVTARR
ncbi:DUF4397 domain-containing protein [Nocardioides coralli]|uniref:DUF4397 domain-containing protein n=1 Tax=Nocardioides coralli TaxID=2872154 RepID=UPI001CA3ED3D|nr:DUF4397 domain-containing protein [Nocardioides coralli]QZY28323.1 DUF4397 domain-containing protein [Nocardioides coralli]